MFVKKIVIVLCLYGMPIIFAAEVRETSLLSEAEVIDPNEQNIIVVGGASYGNNAIIGKACIVMKRKDLYKIHQGDIVIAPAIHSTWYAELSIAAAIITEKGDASSNAIALGKKLTIPVIVGASDATKLIINGQTITCDPITRNIYHVAYPDFQEIHFDTLTMPQKDDSHQTFHDKMGKLGKVRPALISGKPAIDTKDSVLHQHGEAQGSAAMIHTYKGSMINTAKKLYSSHLTSFKKYVADMKSDLYKASWAPDFVFKSVAKSVHKCDDFAIDCVEIVKPFFAQDQTYIESKMYGLNDFMDYIGEVLAVCHEKFAKEPVNFNQIARVCHKMHVESMDLPLDVDKKELIESPIKYKNIEKKIDPKDKKVFLEERDKRVIAGLFVRFVYEEIYGHSSTK